MVKTSTAERHGYRCPECGDELSSDVTGKGFVRHISNRACKFEVGQRDKATASVRVASKTPGSLRDGNPFAGEGLDRVAAMLRRATTAERIMPPTDLFNEGWLLRLALDWFDRHPGVDSPIAVPVGTRWYSEALLASAFAPRVRGDNLAESHTHADGAIGHFVIGRTGEGDLAVASDASHLVVAEAKLGSKLSAGVTNARWFDQAARNVACVAHALAVSGVRPESMTRLGFFVVAPEGQISSGVFDEQMSKVSIAEKVGRRVSEYSESARDRWLSDWFTPTLDAASIETLSWERVVETIGTHDDSAAQWFGDFYERCLRYNRL